MLGILEIDHELGIFGNEPWGSRFDNSPMIFQHCSWSFGHRGYNTLIKFLWDWDPKRCVPNYMGGIS